MKLYFYSRSSARAAKGNNKVVDCKGNESVNGKRWAVDYKANK